MASCQQCGADAEAGGKFCSECGAVLVFGNALIATFNPTTGWAGKTISYSNGVFTLEGHGTITPQQVIDYDDALQIEWAYEGLREWVQELRAAGAVVEPKEPQTAERRADESLARRKKVKVETYKGDQAAQRGIEKMIAKGWTVQNQSSRKRVWRLSTGLFTRQQIHTVTFVK